MQKGEEEEGIENKINITNEEENDINYRIKMYQVVIPAFLFLSLLAVIANFLVILALKASRVRNATVTLLLSLTCSDIWSSSVMALSLLINSYLPTVLHTQPKPCISLALEMLRTGGLLTAALHLLLIALNHCVGIVRPHMDKNYLRRLAFLLCIFAWSFPSACLFILSLSRPNQGLFNCERVDFYNEKIFRWAVAGFLTILFLAITLCYARLLYLMHSRNINNSNNNSSSSIIIQSIKKNNLNERKRKRERRTLWTTLLICISFLLGWAPASILFAITCSECNILNNIGSFRLLFGLSCVQLSFLLAKSLLNPLIYSLRIPEVREQFNKQINKIKSFKLKYLFFRLSKNNNSNNNNLNKTLKINSPNNSPWKWKRTKRARSHLFGSSISSFTHLNLINENEQQQQQINNLNSLKELFKKFKNNKNNNLERRTFSEKNYNKNDLIFNQKLINNNKRGNITRMSECPDYYLNNKVIYFI
ncbi:G_PROTEIN_RECEP_F1_2 domain-containing protein [Meloidogyne graminicola]|uniref:G_PROTEIN_RECEP_F1_2 domain-containing protein n=1 Tax=Meloidogyne graminicola TaxID=189291 RepID=A0A8S9ZZH3_9BILA|nr:G_PROTEIN_RECEP_F1_2 domain-containing protein [Meloidogyne graminicola]